jgi:peptidoglycan/LPS O-acetylase OafA/YrhL
MLRDQKPASYYNSLLSSVIRRPFRLYLPVIAVTFLTAILMQFPTIFPRQAWTSPSETMPEELWKWFTWTAKYLQPFQTHGGILSGYPYSVVVWTIPVEYKGSMLMYFCTWIYALGFHSRTPRWVFPVILSVTVVGLLVFAKWTMACFIAGWVVCYLDVFELDRPLTAWCSKRISALFNRCLMPHGKWSLKEEAFESLFINLLFGISLYLISQPSHGGDATYSAETPGYKTLHSLIPAAYDEHRYFRFWHSYGSIILLYSLLRLPQRALPRRFLSARPLLYLGRVSFMFYLIHLPLFGIIGGRISRMFGNTIFGDQTFLDDLLWIPDVGPAAMSTRFICSVAVLLPTTLVLADIGTRLIDDPSVKVGKWLVRRMGLEKKRDIAPEASRLNAGKEMSTSLG